MCSVADWMSGSEREQQGNYAAGYRMGKNSGWSACRLEFRSGSGGNFLWDRKCSRDRSRYRSHCFRRANFQSHVSVYQPRSDRSDGKTGIVRSRHHLPGWCRYGYREKRDGKILRKFQRLHYPLRAVPVAGRRSAPGIHLQKSRSAFRLVRREPERCDSFR